MIRKESGSKAGFWSNELQPMPAEYIHEALGIPKISVARFATCFWRSCEEVGDCREVEVSAHDDTIHLPAQVSQNGIEPLE